MQKFTVSRDDSIYQAWPDVALTRSGRLLCVFSECTHHGDRSYTRIVLVQSDDRGSTWTDPVETPLKGIVPDKLLEVESGRWIVSAHHPEDGFLAQFLHYSDDQGKTWSGRITVAKRKGLNLCEVSILPVKGRLVAFLRENSGLGWDCRKTVSEDDGGTWGEVLDFPLPACHRPVSGHLLDGRIMITHRFMQGGKGWLGSWTQNFFAAVTDDDSALAAAAAKPGPASCPSTSTGRPRATPGIQAGSSSRTGRSIS